MKPLTKIIHVNGQEVVMSSIDGRSWFLRPEAMYEFEKRLRDTTKQVDDAFDSEPESLDDAFVDVLN